MEHLDPRLRYDLVVPTSGRVIDYGLDADTAATYLDILRDQGMTVEVRPSTPLAA